MTNDVRKYGLGETKVSGAPRVTQTLEKGTGVFCPNCGCETLFEIEVNSDLAFIHNARKALADGFRVFYTSWW